MLLAEMVEGLEVVGPVVGTPWSGSAITGSAVDGLPVGDDDDEAVASIGITLPASQLYAPDEFHGRMGLVGGSLARCWFSFVHGGTTYVVAYAHNGSYADPTLFVGSLSGATVIRVDLGSVYRSASYVATETASGINTATGTSDATADGADVDIDNASSLTIPDDVDTTDMTLAGFQGVLREIYETSVGITQANGNGGTDSTFAMYVRALSGRTDFPTGRAMRVIGYYIAGHSNFRPRLAHGGLGSAYSADPGSLTIESEARMADALVNGEIGVAPVDGVSANMDTDDGFFIFGRGDTATSPGGTRFRNHGQTLEFNGDLQPSGVLIVDTTADDSADTAFGSSFDITADTTFNVYLTMGVVFEMADASGNYPANGRILKRIGSHLPEGGGTQFIADSTQLSEEVTCHRFIWPEWQSALVTAIVREYDTVNTVGADAYDSRAATYQFPDLDYPSTTAATLLADHGPTGIVSGSFHRFTLSSPLEMGLANATRNISYWCGIAFNYASADGTAIDDGVDDDFEVPVYLDEAAGDDSWIDIWTGSDRNDYLGHHHVPGYSGRVRGGDFRAPTSSSNEYRSINVAGMPHDNWNDAFPNPWVSDGTEDSPSADENMYQEVEVAGMQVAA